MSAQKVTIIFNPVSGSGRAGLLAGQMKESLARVGIAACLEPTSRAGDAIRIAQQRETESRAIMAVGGDGTIREVAAGLRTGKTPLAVLPAGTSNVMALTLGLPTKPHAAAKVVAAGKTIAIDQMLAGPPTGEMQRSLLFVDAGFGGDAVHRLHEYRQGQIAMGKSGNINKASYIRPLGQTLLNLPRPSLEAQIDGKTLPGGPWGWILVTNMTKYAGNIMLDPTVKADDGLLNVIALKTENAYTLLRYMVGGVLGLIPRITGQGKALAAREVLIEGQGPWPVQIDGDPGGHTPLLIRRDETRIPLLVP